MNPRQKAKLTFKPRHGKRWHEQHKQAKKNKSDNLIKTVESEVKKSSGSFVSINKSLFSSQVIGSGLLLLANLAASAAQSTGVSSTAGAESDDSTKKNILGGIGALASVCSILSCVWCCMNCKGGSGRSYSSSSYPSRQVSQTVATQDSVTNPPAVTTNATGNSATQVAVTISQNSSQADSEKKPVPEESEAPVVVVFHNITF